MPPKRSIRSEFALWFWSLVPWAHTGIVLATILRIDHLATRHKFYLDYATGSDELFELISNLGHFGAIVLCCSLVLWAICLAKRIRQSSDNTWWIPLTVYVSGWVVYLTIGFLYPVWIIDF